MDDCSGESTRSLNRPVLQTLYNVSYIELRHNLGRSKIRNWLAKSARGSHLLFIDADSGIISDDYLTKYEDLLPVDSVYGGRHYASTPPAKKHLLHWRYGKCYEDRSVTQREKAAAHSFLTCNCLLSAKAIKSVPFDEKIEGYGYEDLVLAEALVRQGYQLTHIDNPVVHLHLDDNQSFLEKTKASISNLSHLVSTDQLSPTKLVRWADALVDWQLDKTFRKLITSREDRWTTQLMTAKGALSKLQLLKLCWYLNQTKKV